MWTTQGRCPQTHRPNNNRNQLQFDEFEKRPNGPEGFKPTWPSGGQQTHYTQLYADRKALSQHGLAAANKPITPNFTRILKTIHIYRGDGLTPDSVRKFAPAAFRKIRAELRKRRDADK
jgi:hypothetical protein